LHVLLGYGDVIEAAVTSAGHLTQNPIIHPDIGDHDRRPDFPGSQVSKWELYKD
jgi:hypothetical protein